MAISVMSRHRRMDGFRSAASRQAKNSRPFRLRNREGSALAESKYEFGRNKGVKQSTLGGNLLFRLVALCYWSICIYFIVPFMLINQLCFGYM